MRTLAPEPIFHNKPFSITLRPSRTLLQLHDSIFWLKLRDLSKNLIQRLEKDCRCCWIMTFLHSKWIFWSYKSPNSALSIALESRHPELSRNI
ncbi:uncharacterized protein DS421_16g537560 [Arachis hypogaea]|nr:uncharacterized protein DS421_16g537560 [Arachis hypogaea]